MTKLLNPLVGEHISEHIHEWGPWVLTKAPTCTEDGVETRTCTLNPAHTETRSVDALGHEWSGWTVTIPPTYETEGEETRYCLHDPSYVETRTIGAGVELEDFYAQVASYETKIANVTIDVSNNLTLDKIVNIPAPDTAGITLTIRSKATPRALTRGFQDNDSLRGLFMVPNGAKLVFENITLDGDRNGYINNAAPLVRVNSGGTLILNTGAILQNSRAMSGGGVYVADGGALIIGGNAVVSDNTERDSSDHNNVYLGNNYITLGTGSNGANKPASGMKVYMHTARVDGMIVQSGASAGQDAYFRVDETGKFVRLQGSRLVINKSDLTDMALIEPGTFLMGSPTTELGRDAEREERHQVTLTKGFYIGRYPVTQNLYRDVTGTNPSSFKTSVNGDNPDWHPVENVTYYDAVDFCNKLSAKEGLVAVYTITNKTTSSGHITNASVTPDTTKNGYRLPTEAEWEYACRAGTITAYNVPLPNGSDTLTDDTGWYQGNSDGRTHEVGLKLPNAWGLYDMHGNVWEWMRDRFVNHPSTAQTNPVIGSSTTSNNSHVLKGGSWSSSGSDNGILRSALRRYIASGTIGNINGFRVIRNAP